MSTSGAVQEAREVWQPPISKPLDETVWQAWVAKGRARRNRAARLTAAKWVSLAGLVVVAGLGSRVGPYDVAARFVVAAGAIVVMFDAIRAGHFAIAAVFAALTLLYNPLAPVFSFSGDWPRAVVAASAIPFVASLTARNLRKERNA